MSRTCICSNNKRCDRNQRLIACSCMQANPAPTDAANATRSRPEKSSKASANAAQATTPSSAIRYNKLELGKQGDLGFTRAADDFHIDDNQPHKIGSPLEIPGRELGARGRKAPPGWAKINAAAVPGCARRKDACMGSGIVSDTGFRRRGPGVRCEGSQICAKRAGPFRTVVCGVWPTTARFCLFC
ncbi:hypothetical protein MFRU_011g02620 [Monilinia fructicola]|nr:hypothetical protein MFRU_011g02620 [Monilinia fructicola]